MTPYKIQTDQTCQNDIISTITVMIHHSDDSVVLLIVVFSKVTILWIFNPYNIFETSYLFFFSIFKNLIKMM